MHRVAALEKIQVIHAKKQIRLIGKQASRIRLTNLIYLLTSKNTHQIETTIVFQSPCFKRLAKLPSLLKRRMCNILGPIA